jgi:hypothetical protein
MFLDFFGSTIADRRGSDPPSKTVLISTDHAAVGS